MRFTPTLLCAALFAISTAPGHAASNAEYAAAAAKIMKNPTEYISEAEVEKLRTPANNADLQEVAREISQETNRRIDEAVQRLKFDEQSWVYDQDAEVTAGQGTGQNLKPRSALGASGEVRYVVYLSLGMPDQEFVEAMQAIKSREDTFGVIIGLADKDHSIPDTMTLLYKKWNSHNPDVPEPPLIYMDPNLFTDYAVETVPTIIRFDGDAPTLRAKGMLNVDWVEQQHESGKTGDIGQHGPVYEIAEEHFMETVQRRMAALDEEKLTNEAIGRFWGNQKFSRLPKAQETGSYLVDLTFTVPQDIKTPNGEYLAKAGQKVNPLSVMPFQRIGIVFDGSDPKQVDWARKEANKAMDGPNVPILMITDLDISEDGWKAFESLNNSIPGVSVKMANQPILQRFQVEKVPSRFEQDGMMIRVTEFAEDDY